LCPKLCACHKRNKSTGIVDITGQPRIRTFNNFNFNLNWIENEIYLAEIVNNLEFFYFNISILLCFCQITFVKYIQKNSIFLIKWKL
jgi:hypothetical protein